MMAAECSDRILYVVNASAWQMMRVKIEQVHEYGTAVDTGGCADQVREVPAAVQRKGPKWEQDENELSVRNTRCTQI